MNWTKVQVFVTAALVIIGWWVVNLLAKQRENKRDQKLREADAADAKAARKREFIAFLEGWKAQFDGSNFCGGGRGSHFQKTLPDFSKEARRIEADFTDAAKLDAFKSAKNKLTSLTPSAVDDPYDNKGKKLLLKSIQDVIDSIG